jgi:hypothetical protein
VVLQRDVLQAYLEHLEKIWREAESCGKGFSSIG